LGNLKLKLSIIRGVICAVLVGLGGAWFFFGFAHDEFGDMAVGLLFVASSILSFVSLDNSGGSKNDVVAQKAITSLIVLVVLGAVGYFAYQGVYSDEKCAESSAEEILQKKFATKIECPHSEVVDQIGNQYTVYLEVLGQNAFGATLHKSYLVYVKIDEKTIFDYHYHSKVVGAMECSSPPVPAEISSFRMFYD